MPGRVGLGGDGWFMMGVGEIETASFVDVCVVLTVKCTLFFREMAQQ